MSTADLTSSAVSQIAIRALDVDRATKFYKDVLGLPFLFQFPGLAFFQSGAVRLMLSKAEKPEFDHPSSLIYFKVQGIEAIHAELARRGVDFIDAPHQVHRAQTYDLWMTFFRDSEGNHLALMEEKTSGSSSSSGS